MANRYFNKQVAESRKPLAHGGPADKIKKATPMPIEVDLSNPRDKVRPNPRKRSPGPRSGRPSLADTIRKATPPSNPRKKLKPFPNQAVPDRPRPKLGRPSRPMPKDPIDKMEPRRPRPKLPGKPSGPKGLTPEQIKRLNELMKKRKGLDTKKPNTIEKKILDPRIRKQLEERFSKNKIKTKPESSIREKNQADYMKKHGKNEPRRKTLSVTNSYKKEVEGLK